MLLKCAICSNTFSWHRDHCPVCGSRRTFVASHSFAPTRVTVRAWNELKQLEVVNGIDLMRVDWTEDDWREAITDCTPEES